MVTAPLTKFTWVSPKTVGTGNPLYVAVWLPKAAAPVVQLLPMAQSEAIMAGARARSVMKLAPLSACRAG